MGDVLLVILMLGGYLFVMRVLLPKMGVET